MLHPSLDLWNSCKFAIVAYSVSTSLEHGILCFLVIVVSNVMCCIKRGWDEEAALRKRKIAFLTSPI